MPWLCVNFTPCAEIEGLAEGIGHLAAGFEDDAVGGSLIPDIFAVVGAIGGGEAQEEIGLTGCEEGVFGLAIHADGVGGVVR